MHTLRRQLVYALPHDAKVNRQLVAAHQPRTMRRVAAALWSGT